MPKIIKSLLSFLLKVLVVLVLMCCFGLASFQGVTKYLTGDFYDFKKAVKEAESNTGQAKEETEEVTVDDKSLENILLFVDSEDGTSDYIILSMLNTDTNALDLIMLPQNAQVTVSKSIQKKLSKKMDGISASVEFQAIERAFGADSYDMIASIMEEMLSIKVNGWDHMTSQNAIDFLNTLKSVTLSLTDTISYRDMDGILHMIEKGDTEIDGEQGFAYMTYLDGTDSQESDRLEHEDTYLQLFLSKLIAKKDASTIIETYQNCVESSNGRSFDHMTAAFSAASDFDFITFRILQGSENDDTFEIDSQKAQLQVATLMKQAASYNAEDSLGKESDDESEEDSFDESENGDSKDLSIEIYNAAYVQGLASEWEYYLEDEGYHITFVDTYQDEGPISTTRIIVDKDGIGEDLLKYFDGAEISTGDIDSGGDIRIYVGTDHTKVGEGE